MDQNHKKISNFSFLSELRKLRKAMDNKIDHIFLANAIKCIFQQNSYNKSSLDNNEILVAIFDSM